MTTNVHQSGFKETGVVLNALGESHAYGAGYYYNYYQYYYAEILNKSELNLLRLINSNKINPYLVIFQ